jgi:preprotein translocase subunit SecF
MRPSEIFGLIIRVFGLVLLSFSLWFLVAALFVLVGVKGPHNFSSYFFAGIVTAIFSTYLLRGAPHLVRFSYPKVKDDSSREAPH